MDPDLLPDLDPDRNRPPARAQALRVQEDRESGGPDLSDSAGTKASLVAISGAPGTGTTTLSRLLATSLGWPHVYAGQIFREMAKERGMTLAQFGSYAEAHPDVDRELDRRMVEVARKGGVILEGRMAAWQVREAGAAALTVLLQAPEDVRAARVANREGRTDADEVLREMREREASESKRYLAFYGFDPSEARHYDVVIETHDKTPEKIQALVLARLAG